jgi:hypothetical protein
VEDWAEKNCDCGLDLNCGNFVLLNCACRRRLHLGYLLAAIYETRVEFVCWCDNGRSLDKIFVIPDGGSSVHMESFFTTSVNATEEEIMTHPHKIIQRLLGRSLDELFADECFDSTDVIKLIGFLKGERNKKSKRGVDEPEAASSVLETVEETSSVVETVEAASSVGAASSVKVAEPSLDEAALSEGRVKFSLVDNGRDR